MAEAFFNSLSKKHSATSAGTVVKKKVQGGEVKERVKRVMKEAGVDVSGKTRKQLTKEMVDEADRIIIITESSTHPDYLKDASSKTEYWDIPDTKGQSYEFKEKIRDKIKGEVELLVEEMKKNVQY